MKLVDFSIAEDCIALERDSCRFDLHNSFDFTGFTYSPAQRSLELRWIRGLGDWVKPNEPAELRLDFVGVYLFKARERDPEMPFTEDGCLAHVGFIWNDMLTEMDGYTSNQQKDGCTHFIALFMSRFSIKIGAESVSLHVTGSA